MAASNSSYRIHPRQFWITAPADLAGGRVQKGDEVLITGRALGVYVPE